MKLPRTLHEEITSRATRFRRRVAISMCLRKQVCELCDPRLPNLSKCKSRQNLEGQANARYLLHSARRNLIPSTRSLAIRLQRSIDSDSAVLQLPDQWPLSTASRVGRSNLKCKERKSAYEHQEKCSDCHLSDGDSGF